MIVIEPEYILDSAPTQTQLQSSDLPEFILIPKNVNEYQILKKKI